MKIANSKVINHLKQPIILDVLLGNNTGIQSVKCKTSPSYFPLSLLLVFPEHLVLMTALPCSGLPTVQFVPKCFSHIHRTEDMQFNHTVNNRTLIHCDNNLSPDEFYALLSCQSLNFKAPFCFPRRWTAINISMNYKIFSR